MFDHQALWCMCGQHGICGQTKEHTAMRTEGAVIVPPTGCLNWSSVAASQPVIGHMLQRHCVVKLL